MSKCNNHYTEISGWDLESLADAIEELRYDKLSEFLGYLSEALYQRSIKDNRSGKPQLVMRLQRAGGSITGAKLNIDKAWEICKPYMDENNS